MKQLLLSIVAVGLGSFALCGCGKAPGASPDQAKANYSKMSIDQKIKVIQNAPIPDSAKAQKIAALKAGQSQ